MQSTKLNILIKPIFNIITETAPFSYCITKHTFSSIIFSKNGDINDSKMIIRVPPYIYSYTIENFALTGRQLQSKGEREPRLRTEIEVGQPKYNNLT